jgi:glycosyltransferase involved in cell wall biosynthesis
MSNAAPGQPLADKTIMVIGTDAWNNPLLSKQRLVLELCQQNRVIYVEPFFHLGKLFRPEYWRRRGKGSVYHHEYPPTLTLMRPYRLPKSACVSFLRKISEWAFLFQIWAKRIRPDVIISFSPYFPFLAGRGIFFVYYPVDSFGHPEAHMESIAGENATLAKADLVTAGTDKLYHCFQGRTQHLEFLPHGVDIEALRDDAGKMPENWQSIVRPVIGFVGALNSRLNLDLLEQIAVNRPQWSVVLVGPYQRDDFGGGLSDRDIDRLKQHRNIFLLGPCPSNKVGMYFAAFDVSIMPYDTTHPLVHFASHKPLQCLAVGTPVVTTCPAPDAVLPPNTFVAETPEVFVAAIDRTLKSHSAETRQAYRVAALNFTWKKRIEQLARWIQQYGTWQGVKPG